MQRTRGPVLREYLVSESMAALGIPTTRALAAVTTGENIIRETILPGAVLTRVASSHIRVGTFQFFSARRVYDGLRRLADYTIARHYPEAATAPNPYRALLEGVIARQAELVSRWMLIGFIHGVMNTDNMSICGETIDYGPCAFMDAYHPGTVFSSIDYASRYAYANQSGMAHWNLARLAECLIPLIAEDKDESLKQANDALTGFKDRFTTAFSSGLRQKFGFTTEQDGDKELMQALLHRMSLHKADFTLTFRRLCDAAISTEADASISALFDTPSAFDDWAVHWRERLAREPQEANARRDAMRRVNPALIPRNHRVEAVIEAAMSGRDFAPFEEMLKVLAHPYEDQPALRALCRSGAAFARRLSNLLRHVMTAQVSFETLLIDKANAIAKITLNRPDVLNALNKLAVAELAAAMKEVQADTTIRGVILTGSEDKAFAAGSDIDELSGLSVAEAHALARDNQAVMDLIEGLGKPVIAALNGYAIGAGCELALACTMRIAAEHARFSLPEVRMGLIPGFGGTQRLPRLVGKSPALQMILSGDMMDAQEALRIGLIDEIVPKAKLIGRAEAVLMTIASNAPLAVRFALEAVNKGLKMTQADGLELEAGLFALATSTEDLKEGVDAFFNRRKPRFTGR